MKPHWATRIIYGSLLKLLEERMSILDDAIAANTKAVSDNTTAVNAAVAKLGTPALTQAQLDALTANTTQVEANTTALTNATTPPAPAP